jgi:hypothetical protein
MSVVQKSKWTLLVVDKDVNQVDVVVLDQRLKKQLISVWELVAPNRKLMAVDLDVEVAVVLLE